MWSFILERLKAVFIGLLSLDKEHNRLIKEKLSNYEKRTADMERQLNEYKEQYNEYKARCKAAEDEIIRLRETIIIGGRFPFVISDPVGHRVPLCPVCYSQGTYIRMHVSDSGKSFLCEACRKFFHPLSSQSVADILAEAETTIAKL